MRSDALLAFVPLGSALSLVAGAGISIPSTNIIDLLGAGVGVAPPNIIGNAATFGQDPGVGYPRAELEIGIGQALAGPAGAGLNVAFQYAPDTGAPGGYQPGAWQTAAETGFVPVTQLGAAAKIARLPYLPAQPEGLRPRYARLLFTPSAQLTGGTIAFALTVSGRDDNANRFVPRNFSAT